MDKNYVIGGLKIPNSGDEIANLDQRTRQRTPNDDGFGTSRPAGINNSN